MIKFIINLFDLNTVFLLGYMGCGKSILGKALASQVNISFVDLDTLLTNVEIISIPSEIIVKYK